MADYQIHRYDTTNDIWAKITGSDKVLLGGIDQVTTGTLTLGTSNATAITIGQAAVTTTVAGPLTVTGATILNGAVTLGDATSDDITFNGYLVGDIIPKADSSENLGTTTLRFLEVFSDAVTTEMVYDSNGSLVIESYHASAQTTVSFENSGTSDVAVTINGELTVTSTARFQGTIYLGNEATDTIVPTGVFNGDLIANLDSTHDIGSDSVRWANGYFDDLYVTNGIKFTSTYTATVALSLGEVVYKTGTANYVNKAIASAAATMKVIGIAAGAISADASGPIQVKGTIAGVGSSWTVGGAVYVSGTTAGLLTQTPPATAGHVIMRVGWAKNSTDLEIDFGPKVEV